MKIAKTLVFTAILAASTYSQMANAWGQTGHRVSGKIAELYLTPEASAYISLILENESLAENAAYLGKLFRSEMRKLIKRTPLVKLVRGKGLLNAIVINDDEDSSTAWDICMALKEKGLLAKPTHGNIIRFAPPLVMTEDQMLDCVSIISKTIMAFKKTR